MTMRELTYQVSFNTPAFLGNAEQQAQWRTPPFKALLRQWWRVVKAPDVGYDHRKLLALENELFGSAGDDSGGGRSKVQLRLSRWDAGTLTELPRMAAHQHDGLVAHEARDAVALAIVMHGLAAFVVIDRAIVQQQAVMVRQGELSALDH